MAAGATRVFTEQELAEAGCLTLDLVAQRLQAGEREAAVELVRRFELELMTMFYSYSRWEVSILECIAELGGDAEKDRAKATMENYDIAPERELQLDGVAEAWLAELKTSRGELRANHDEQALTRARAVREHGLQIHDGLMSRGVCLLSEIYRTFGEEKLGWVLSQVMKPSSMDPEGKLPFREKVQNIMMFTRSHLLPFTVTEDDEKVTFMPDPCPSGARLIRAGHYEAPRNNTVVVDQGPLTYGRKDIPIYCCHEPAMELGSILATGVPLFIVDPPPDVGVSPCRVYVYKNPVDIPEQYYERLGLKKPEDLIASTRGG
jgi:hypothetical protein